MINYAALITDLDGTAIKLSSDESDITRSTIEAVSKAQDMGIKVACATGRRWSGTKNVVDRLGITNACIIEGGTRIIDPLTEKKTCSPITMLKQKKALPLYQYFIYVAGSVCP